VEAFVLSDVPVGTQRVPAELVEDNHGIGRVGSGAGLPWRF